MSSVDRWINVSEKDALMINLACVAAISNNPHYVWFGGGGGKAITKEQYDALAKYILMHG